MQGFIEWFHALTPATAVVRLLIATLLSGLIGNERGRHGRAAGMRTHILVCLGAALTMLVGQFAADTMTGGTDPLRLGAQVISGIGFLGVGTILIKDRFQVTGLTTAAGLWATAAIGLAVGIGYITAGVATAILVLTANLLLPRIERANKARTGWHLYVELSDPQAACALSEALDGLYGLESLQVVPPRSGTQGTIGVELELAPGCKKEPTEVCRLLMERAEVQFAVPIQ